MKRIKRFLQNETILVISFFLALISAFFVTPGMTYITAIDFRTLALLFCLMVVMEGLRHLCVFDMLAEKMLQSIKSMRGLAMLLCLLCFFSSMLITNDVALITFVPFTLLTLRLSNMSKHMVWLVTLETVAANLGSMLTPVGNPQNLYLFSAFYMKMDTFISTVFPYGFLSLILMTGAVFIFKKEPVSVKKTDQKITLNKIGITLYCVLFLIALLAVFHAFSYIAALVITVALVLVYDRKTLLRVDYSLLLTFVFLFVFIGNLGEIPIVNAFLQKAIAGNEVLVSVAASQIFSNVPAAILLSGFTDNASALLIGTNLGGLGTIIASMASLISFKLIVKENVKARRYLLVFTLVNLFFLICNLMFWYILK